MKRVSADKNATEQRISHGNTTVDTSVAQVAFLSRPTEFILVFVRFILHMRQFSVYCFVYYDVFYFIL